MALKFTRLRRIKKKTGPVIWQKAPDIKKRLGVFIKELDLNFLKTSRIFVYRSFNSSSRAYARTWGFPRIWQISLEEEPAYVIEVLSERFDRLHKMDQDKILLHEIAHIPRNFSGSLVAHTRRGKNSFHDKLENMIFQYLKNADK